MSLNSRIPRVVLVVIVQLGKLKKCMYGTSGAAKNWENENQRTMAELGFKTGKATTCALQREERDMLAVIRGDDVTVLADQGRMSWV